jgi:hypothetical protein
LLKVAVVAALLHAYAYGAVACNTVEDTEPLANPQLAFVPVSESCATCDALTVNDCVDEQPSASETETVYNCGESAFIDCVVDALLQAYVNGDVPLVTVAAIEPLSNPHVVFVIVPATDGTVVVVMIAEVVAVQLFASVTVTVYAATARFDRSCVVAALLHANVNGAVPAVTINEIEPLA